MYLKSSVFRGSELRLRIPVLYPIPRAYIIASLGVTVYVPRSTLYPINYGAIVLGFTRESTFSILI